MHVRPRLQSVITELATPVIDNLRLTSIITDLSAGAGCELDSKLRAAHSSAALAINTFGPWRNDPSTLQVGGVRGFHGLKFEATCPTELGGNAAALGFDRRGRSAGCRRVEVYGMDGDENCEVLCFV